ncbi:hypothetical protein XMM354_003303 [Aliiroseovarius sp. xm-m-354]|uniref:hypothetical protein n=1 Tax=Aliiroseovarius sp. xm-m-354 TaxID=2651830 RepID=UPI001568A499|nr:hypothetical protein [Aliiroseovarius sp. xm-m-354]NRP51504.1 hypothetical protein [Aliiroseovarius sp. xm-m-354]
MIKITVESNGIILEPHWYDPKIKSTKADRFGKRGGYRVHPPGDGHNESGNAVFYRSLEDVAEYLIACPEWGLRFKVPSGPANIFNEDILIDGKPR